MSEVFGTVLLTVITIVFASGFGLVVFSSFSGDSETPHPTAAFTVDARPGMPYVNVTLREGSSFPVADARFSLALNNTLLPDGAIHTPLAEGRFSPGDTMRYDLQSGVVGAGARLAFYAVHLASGEPIGYALASVPDGGSPSGLASNTLTAGVVSFWPTSVAADGATTTTITVGIGSTSGLGVVRTVAAHLSAVGGADQFVLNDAGVEGDAVAGDGIYSGRFTASFSTLPEGTTSGTATIPVAVTDVFGNTAPVTSGVLALTGSTFLDLLDEQSAKLSGMIANTSAATNILGVGGISRNLPGSDSIGNLTITNFTFRDTSKLSGDAILYRVSDIVDTTKTWIVTVYWDDCAPAPYGGITQIVMSRDGVPGSASWVPSTTYTTNGKTMPCWTVDYDTIVNLVDVNLSVNATGATPAWTGTGNGTRYAYTNAGIGDLNQGIVPFFGDTQPTADPHRTVEQLGLGTASVQWTRATPPAPAFTSSRTGLTIHVDASTSQGFGLTYAWDWGDGSPTSAGVTASRTYAAAGNYTVTLTATNGAGQSASESMVVQPNQDPAASMTLAATAARTVRAESAGSSDADGHPLTVTWVWGDGTTSVGANATKTYATAAQYEVRVYVNDTLGGSATATGVIGEAPTASFTHTASGLTVATDASASSHDSGEALAYAWDWGDGASSAGVTASRTYDANATDTVTLTVTSLFGRTATASQSVLHDGNTWLQCPPTAVAHGSIASCANLRTSTDAGASATLTEANNASVRQAWMDFTMNGQAEPTKTHTLTARARHDSGGAEELSLQIMDPTDGTWYTPPTFTWSSATMTTTQTLFVMPAGSPYWNDGAPILRFIDASCASGVCSGPDNSITSWEVDWVRVVSS